MPIEWVATTQMVLATHLIGMENAAIEDKERTITNYTRPKKIIICLRSGYATSAAFADAKGDPIKIIIHDPLDVYMIYVVVSSVLSRKLWLWRYSTAMVGCLSEPNFLNYF